MEVKIKKSQFKSYVKKSGQETYVANKKEMKKKVKELQKENEEQSKELQFLELMLELYNVEERRDEAQTEFINAEKALREFQTSDDY